MRSRVYLILVRMCRRNDVNVNDLMSLTSTCGYLNSKIGIIKRRGFESIE